MTTDEKLFKGILKTLATILVVGVVGFALLCFGFWQSVESEYVFEDWHESPDAKNIAAVKMQKTYHMDFCLNNEIVFQGENVDSWKVVWANNRKVTVVYHQRQPDKPFRQAKTVEGIEIVCTNIPLK